MPPRTPLASIPIDAHVEEVVLSDVDPVKQQQQEQYAAMQEDEEHGGGGPGVQCAQQ